MSDTAIAVALVLMLAAIAGAAAVSARIRKRAEARQKAAEAEKKAAAAEKKKAEAEKKHKAYWSKNRVRSRESCEIAFLIHEQVNWERGSRGIPKLAYDHHLAFIARGHSRDMAHYDFLGHVNGQGESPSARATRKDYRFDGGNFSGIGENCYQLWGVGHYKSGQKYNKDLQRLATEAVHGWMNSPGHRRNILNSRYRVEGIGFARSRKHRGKVYLTQNFHG